MNKPNARSVKFKLFKQPARAA